MGLLWDHLTETRDAIDRRALSTCPSEGEKLPGYPNGLKYYKFEFKSNSFVAYFFFQFHLILR